MTSPRRAGVPDDRWSAMIGRHGRERDTLAAQQAAEAVELAILLGYTEQAETHARRLAWLLRPAANPATRTVGVGWPGRVRARLTLWRTNTHTTMSAFREPRQ